MDIVEQQDVIIHRLGSILSRQAATLSLLKNDGKLNDMKLGEDADDMKKEIDEYFRMRDAEF